MLKTIVYWLSKTALLTRIASLETVAQYLLIVINSVYSFHSQPFVYVPLLLSCDSVVLVKVPSLSASDFVIFDAI